MSNFYQDEMRVFKIMTCGKVLQDILGDSTKDIFNVQSGKGERSILCHFGSAETGLLKNCLLLFRGLKSNKKTDYHSEMSWKLFSDWFETVVFLQIAATQKRIRGSSRQINM